MSQIKSIIKNKKFSNMSEYDEYIETITEESECKKSKVREVVAKYTDYNNDKLCISLKNKTDNTYDDIKKLIKSSPKSSPKQQSKQSIDFMIITDPEEYDRVNKTKEPKTEPGYKYPKEPEYKPTKKIYGPIGSQWVHDVQIHDERDKRLAKIVDNLLAIEYPAQRSPEWFASRDSKITASDGGCVLNMNHYEPQYKFVIKKIGFGEFISNEFCYHGKKYEQIATMIYEYRMNVRVHEFGLIAHPKHSFLGASPDGIVGHYKLDGEHKTKHVGKMLEIKVPLRRMIKLSGEIKGDICPIYYWVQCQQQLECCDLDECDFWQCDLREYDSREDFINDTDLKEPFRSKTTGYEKGCLIQLIPLDKAGEVASGNYESVIWDHAIAIYPPKIEMTPLECDLWISDTMSKFHTMDQYKGFYVDKVIYWKLMRSNCVTIERDKKWFAENLPTYKKVWDYVLYFRENKEHAEVLMNYINSIPVDNRDNDDIMRVIDMLVKGDVKKVIKMTCANKTKVFPTIKKTTYHKKK